MEMKSSKEEEEEAERLLKEWKRTQDLKKRWKILLKS